MSILIVVIHVIVCLALILIVLLQTGKGADMGAAFGGGASQTLFGTSGASTFLSKLTTAAAVIFMLTSLTLAYMAGNRGGNTSLVTEPPPAQSQPAEQKATDTATLPVETDQDKEAAPAVETPQTTDEQPAAQPATSEETPAAPATGDTTQPEEPAPTE